MKNVISEKEILIFFVNAFLSFQETGKMDSIEYNGIKVEFSYFVKMALQYNMPWKTLTMLLKDLAPTLNETREVICILLKELEAMQSILKKKDDELEMYRNVGASEDSQNIPLETETIPDVIQENDLQSSVKETEVIDDEIEVLEVVKESINEEMHLNMRKDSKSYKKNAIGNGGHDSVDIATEESMSEIDNEWYIFVKNDKPSEPAPKSCVQDKESYSENEIQSSYEIELKEQTTKNDEHDIANKYANNYVREMDNDGNDKTCGSETENEGQVDKETKKRPFQCTFCQKCFQNSGNLKKPCQNSHRRNAF